MKTIIAIAIAITLAATLAQVQTTTRCVKNWDGSVTCTTTRNWGF
ncbi:MAG: hypothetical protein ACR2IX_08300 [Limnohabitans sp.]